MSDLNIEPRISDDSYSEILCRICYTSDNKKYVHPCKCKGTIGLVHADCLEQWLVETGRNNCELCGSTYSTERELRYSALRSLFLWFLTRHKYSFVHLNYVRVLRTDVIISGILTVLVLAADFFCVGVTDIYITSLRNDWPSTNKWTSFALFMILAIFVSAYFTWMIIAVKYHIHKWYWWWQHSLTVKLIADAVDIESYRQYLIDTKNAEKAASTQQGEDKINNSQNSASASQKNVNNNENATSDDNAKSSNVNT